MATHPYQVIRADLEARIVSGDLGPGDKVPTEAELKEQYGVSRSVAQRVLNELALAGLVVRRKRLGTHVADGARQINLVRSVDPRIGDGHLPGRMEVVEAVVVPAEKALVDMPGLAGTDPVIQMTRVRRDLSDDSPTLVEVSGIPFSLAPSLLEERLEDVSVRAYFADNEVPVARSRMYFDPILLDERNAELLDEKPGIPVLRRRRLMWQPSGRLAESAAYYLRPGAMEFYIEYTDDSL